MCTINDNHMMYGSEIYYTVPETWYMIDVIFLILGYTLPFYPLNSPKNENLKKKKMPGIIMIVIMMIVIMTYDS